LLYQSFELAIFTHHLKQRDDDRQATCEIANNLQGSIAQNEHLVVESRLQDAQLEQKDTVLQKALEEMALYKASMAAGQLSAQSLS